MRVQTENKGRIDSAPPRLSHCRPMKSVYLSGNNAQESCIGPLLNFTEFDAINASPAKDSHSISLRQRVRNVVCPSGQ